MPVKEFKFEVYDDDDLGSGIIDEDYEDGGITGGLNDMDDLNGGFL